MTRKAVNFCVNLSRFAESSDRLTSPFYTPRSNPEGVAITVACIDWGDYVKPEILTKRFDGINWEESYKATAIANETKSR